ncbi:MAG: DUF4199 domain-containing protein [Alphaproteobacteria bacterium]|nr:DUF4199 domain-containing protein [Alphaproteobacteria bacterium]
MNNLKDGITLGVAVTGWTMAEYLAGLHNDHFGVGLWTGLGALVLALWVLYAKLKSAAKTEKPAIWKIITDGAIMSFIGSAFYGGFLILYFTAINPEFYDALAAYIQAHSNEVAPGAIDHRIQAAKTAYAPYTQFKTSLIGGTAIGALASFLIAVILKHRQKGASPVQPTGR